MGFLIKFILGFIVVYFLLKSFVSFLIGKRKGAASSHRRQQENQTKQPENQHDRIMEYQKKKFESSEIEDADFVEVKKEPKI